MSHLFPFYTLDAGINVPPGITVAPPLKIFYITILGEHITDIYITETGTTELENLSHDIIDIFIIESQRDSHLTLLMLQNIHICHK